MRFAVADSNIHINDGYLVISQSMILRIDSNDLEVTVKLKTSHFGVGTFAYFKFNHDAKKQQFLDAVGEIDQYAREITQNNINNYFSDDCFIVAAMMVV